MTKKANGITQPLIKSPGKIYEYSVVGGGLFPFDMLRHDEAWPATGQDVIKIMTSFTLRVPVVRRSIKLQSYRKPTTERWSSFIWLVVPH